MPTPPPGTPDLDLTLPGTAGSINGAVFSTGQTQSAGTGTFNSFVQIQHNGTEQGYNTDANAQYDEKNSHSHNHSVLLAEVPIVIGDGSNGTAEGVAYREFLLDLNETNGGYISLDALQIWQNEAGNLTNFTAGSGFAGGHTNYLAYDLDAGGNRWIALTDGLAHGSGQSDYRILIPDSFFINDAAHRYVTLYSAFGQQAGWGSDGGFEEWGLHGSSGNATSAFSVQKTATVPGGTADAAGEVISYAIAVSNTGNTALTGITVVDPTVSNLAAVLSGGFNIGDTNQDNQLSAGETWQYTANHTVTQTDIDSNGDGDGVIQNTVTADSTQTAPVQASASVAVDRRPTVDLEKTANVASVNAAGDVITYTITVENTGNTTLNIVDVTDSQVNIVTPVLDFGAPILGPNLLQPVLNGDYNAGDTNQNGFEDPGETFQFTIAGDTNNNGIEDPGETFILTNVGDTNQSGAQDDGETFQYYNAGDTNHNGVEDDGETFQYVVNNSATPVLSGGFNVGDTNQDGQLNLDETWQYTVSYTVTQDDIDNGGVVNPALTHNNTAAVTTAQDAADSDTVSVSVVQDPRVTLTKSASVADGTADEVGDVINYTINVANAGNMTLTGISVSDPSVTGLAYVSGDVDNDGKLDLTETWVYTASHTVTQGDIDNGGVVDPALTYDNTASVTTNQGTALPSPDPDANDSDSASVPIVQSPSITLDKTATVPGGTADTAGEVINYTIDVTNNGNMTLTAVSVTDAFVSNLTLASGDDGDGLLDVGETWHYTASHTVTQAELDNNGGGDGVIENTASVTTAQGASANDSASVTVVATPPLTYSFTLEKFAFGYIDNNNDDVANAGDTLVYHFNVHNTGTGTQTNVQVNDVDGNVNVTGGVLASLAGGATDSTTWAATYTITSIDVSDGYHDNNAVGNSDFGNAISGTVHTLLAGLNELIV